MNAMHLWGAGQWALFAVNVAILAFGLYQIAFASRILAKREAAGEDEGGYRSSLERTHPRTVGLILIGFGAFGLARNFGLI
jgi:hypothetical protein